MMPMQRWRARWHEGGRKAGRKHIDLQDAGKQRPYYGRG